MIFRKRPQLKFKWLTWRFLPRPEELSVKSILETILYLSIFFICWYLFVQWNDVPVRNEYIHVDCLKRPSDNQNKDIAPIAEIEYCIPMTSTNMEPDGKTQLYRLSTRDSTSEFIDYYFIYPHSQSTRPGLSISINQWNTEYHLDRITGLIISELNNDSTLHDSIKKDERSKSPFWQVAFSSNKEYPYKSHIANAIKNSDTYGIAKDEIRNRSKRILLQEKIASLPVKLDSLNHALKGIIAEKKLDVNNGQGAYYFGVISSNLSGLYYSKKAIEETSIKNNGWSILRIFQSKNNSVFESFNSGSKSFLAKGQTGLIQDHQYRKPSWFRLEDISQAYYNVKLESATIDSIILKFDFVGATNFSLINPEPDKITMSSIEFSNPEKILDIRLNGLKFHAKFIELENKQNIRLFAITTIIGSMFVILMGIIFFGLIKIIMNYFDRYKSK